MTKVLFDMDGVLFDFVRAAFKLHGKHVDMLDVQWDFLEQIGFSGESKSKFWEPMGKDFWEHVPLLIDGLQLLFSIESLIGGENIAFLTRPRETDGCMDGKKAAVGRLFPSYASRLFQGDSKEFFGTRDFILIDDHEMNCRKFFEAGGTSLMVPRPWNSRKRECKSDGSFDAWKLFDEFCSKLDAVQ
jgi:hypothetical protein